MHGPGRFPAVATRWIDTYKGELTTLSLWGTGVWFFGMAYAVTGSRSIGDDEVVAFTAAFALASASATVTALAVTGRARWALGAAVCFSAFAMIAAGITIWLSWIAGSPAPPLRPLISTGEIAEAAIVAGLLVGVGIGLVAGLIILLARRWPRLVGWLSAGVLVACVTHSAHIAAFHRVADYAMEAGIGHHTGFYPASRVELPSATGAGAGAIVGAAAVGAVLWWVSQPRRTSRDPSLPRPIPS